MTVITDGGSAVLHKESIIRQYGSTGALIGSDIMFNNSQTLNEKISSLNVVNLNYAGVYSGATQYYLNDWVSYNGSNYVCILDSIGNLPTNTTYWTLWGGSLEADFYKYQIVPTVASNNLTVTLKNYNGDTPTATAPNKSQVGDTIRTLTSALSLTANAGTSYLNMGSSEHATKDTDLFCYLQWNTTTSALNLLVSRIPFATTMADFVNSNTNEKGVIGIINYNATDKVTNIGRFSAILSAGAGYTWSLGSGPTINHYIDKSDWKDWVGQLSCSGSMTVTSPVINIAKYRMNGKGVDVILQYSGTLGGTVASDFRCTLPFTPADSNLPCAMSCYNNFDFISTGIFNTGVTSSITARAGVTAWTLGNFRTAGANTFYQI